MQSRHVLVLIVLFGGLCGHAQRRMLPGQEEFLHIVDGMRALQVSVELDRADYLPGERICATVSVENPTDAPILAFAPFRARGTALGFSKLNEDGEWWPITDWTPTISVEPVNMMAGRKVQTIAAGERLSEHICFVDEDHLGSIIRHHSTWVLPPGQYKVWFSYQKSAEAEFRVLPVDEQVAYVGQPLPDADQYRREIPWARAGCLGMLAAALRTGEHTILVRSMSGAKNTCQARPAGEKLLRELWPFARVAETRDGVKSIDLIPLGDGAVEMNWEDGLGLRHREILPKPEFPKPREP